MPCPLFSPGEGGHDDEVDGSVPPTAGVVYGDHRIGGHPTDNTTGSIGNLDTSATVGLSQPCPARAIPLGAKTFIFAIACPKR
jgi:hypothetical protein